MNDPITRRNCLRVMSGAIGVPFLSSGRAAEPSGTFRVHAWERDARNPVFPPGTNDFDNGSCMNPFVLLRDGEYWMFYAGGDARGRRRICLATCPVDDLTAWRRHGPLFDVGGRDRFDESWCVLPCVHRIGGLWHLYYTGRSAAGNAGLQAFRGIGLAVSEDLRNWRKTSDEPVLLGDGYEEWPGNRGVAGGGSILELPQEDGRILYRMHYTVCTGTPNRDMRLDQAKHSAIVHSYDGRVWFDKRIILRARADAAYENAASIALNVWRAETEYRAVYAAIGTRFGAYSICEASSPDGLRWERGKPGENLALAPSGEGWESRMTEYPNVVREGDRIRLFYCGNGYGRTGIGTASARPLQGV